MSKDNSILRGQVQWNETIGERLGRFFALAGRTLAQAGGELLPVLSALAVARLAQGNTSTKKSARSGSLQGVAAPGGSALEMPPLRSSVAQQPAARRDYQPPPPGFDFQTPRQPALPLGGTASHPAAGSPGRTASRQAASNPGSAGRTGAFRPGVDLPRFDVDMNAWPSEAALGEPSAFTPAPGAVPPISAAYMEALLMQAAAQAEYVRPFNPVATELRRFPTRRERQAGMTLREKVQAIPWALLEYGRTPAPQAQVPSPPPRPQSPQAKSPQPPSPLARQLAELHRLRQALQSKSQSTARKVLNLPGIQQHRFPTRPDLPLSQYPDVTHNQQIYVKHIVGEIRKSYLPEVDMFFNFPPNHRWDLKGQAGIPKAYPMEWGLYKGVLVHDAYLANNAFGHAAAAAGMSLRAALDWSNVYYWVSHSGTNDQPEDRMAIISGWLEYHTGNPWPDGILKPLDLYLIEKQNRSYYEYLRSHFDKYPFVKKLEFFQP